MEDKEKGILETLQKLNDKNFGIYFFTIDTKGNATAGIATIYEHVKVLNQLGYKAYILHEKKDYTSVAGWLGEEYAKLPHVSIESQDLKVSASDFIVIPEVFTNVMEQTKNFPCKRIVFSQSYDYILELLMLGAKWSDYGITDVITTTDKQKDYISSLFPGSRIDVVPVSIPKFFKPDSKPKKPIVTLHTRDQKEALKIVKAFYLKYPIYKWITFRELRGIPREQFAKFLGEACLSVWVDPISSFGTFPLESMECQTPVIGLIPDMIPEWMEESTENGDKVFSKNGVWVNSTLQIPDLIATYLQVWLEDNLPADLTDAMKNTTNKYTEESQATKIAEVYGKLVNNRKEEITALMNKLHATAQ